MERKGTVSKVLGVVLVGLLLIALVYFFIQIFHIIPSNYKQYTSVIQAFLFGVILYIVLRVILRGLQITLEKRLHKKYVRPLIFIVSLLGYFIILLVILGQLGVDLSSVILGGAFAGAIVGLAAQQILSNFFSGILLIWSRPFVPGDYIEFNAWQVSYLLPSYSPKYLSRDEFRWKIAGHVEDISMNYTTIIEEDGTILKLPNSIVIQGAVAVNPVRNRIQIRVEISKAVEFQKLRTEIGSVSSKIEGIESTDVSIDEIGKETYLVKVILRITVPDSEAIRAKFMENLLPLTK